MTRSIVQFQSRNEAIYEFSMIAWEVMKDGLYHYEFIYPNGKVERVYEVKNGIQTQVL